MTIKVLKKGILTTIQDLGRPGYYHLGIPMGGGMDRLSLRTANLLVGNQEDAAVLEAVFMGPELEFQKDACIAVTGGEMIPKVDGEDKKTWTAFTIKKGQVLSFNFLSFGARIYIAIAGGIDTPLHLNSRSTYQIGALGGIDGSALKENDLIPIGNAEYDDLDIGVAIPTNLRTNMQNNIKLRVLTGLYNHRLSDESKKTFFEDEWRVASEADRMGYRFQGGRALQFIERKPPFGAGSDPSNITDACYPYGSIQVPNGTEPIILHRDAVSGGGYMMIGTIISADMDIIGQLQPNFSVQFVEVTMEQALQARKERGIKINKIRELLT